jgi:hypothetical protein
VGDTMMVQGRVEVTSVSMNDSQEADAPRRCVSLQLTSMGLGPDLSTTDATKSLYTEQDE